MFHASKQEQPELPILLLPTKSAPILNLVVEVTQYRVVRILKFYVNSTERNTCTPSSVTKRVEKLTRKS